MAYPYRWNFKDTVFTKDKGKVFSCFACGGGSTMGYKLAGFDVIGCNEIDPKMFETYKANHNPKFGYLEPIQTFKLRNDLPSELYELDILDGSPPCSTFSLTGNREEDWGKEKQFREGQAKQVLDTLFFDFIDLAKKLQPKVVVAENVAGLMMGAAKEYVKKIYIAFQEAGYELRIEPYLLDASKMGVPQRRKRVFFIALRKDLAGPLMEQVDMFQVAPKLSLEFNEPEIPFTEIEDTTDLSIKDHTVISTFYDLTKPGYSFSTVHPKGNFFNDYKVNPNEPINTICADPNHGAWHYSIKRHINEKEAVLAGSFPTDYNFLNLKSKYLIGMSVPPVMVAQIATKIHEQWLLKI